MEQVGPYLVQHHCLIGILRRSGSNAHVVQEAVYAMGLHQLPGEVGVKVLGVVAGLQDQRFSINITHTGEAVHRDALLKLHFAADLRGRHNDAEIHHGG